MVKSFKEFLIMKEENKNSEDAAKEYNNKDSNKNLDDYLNTNGFDTSEEKRKMLKYVLTYKTIDERALGTITRSNSDIQNSIKENGLTKKTIIMLLDKDLNKDGAIDDKDYNNLSNILNLISFIMAYKDKSKFTLGNKDKILLTKDGKIDGTISKIFSEDYKNNITVYNINVDKIINSSLGHIMDEPKNDVIGFTKKYMDRKTITEKIKQIVNAIDPNAPKEETNKTVDNKPAQEAKVDTTGTTAGGASETDTKAADKPSEDKKEEQKHDEGYSNVPFDEKSYQALISKITQEYINKVNDTLPKKETPKEDYNPIEDILKENRLTDFLKHPARETRNSFGIGHFGSGTEKYNKQTQKQAATSIEDIKQVSSEYGSLLTKLFGEYNDPSNSYGKREAAKIKIRRLPYQLEQKLIGYAAHARKANGVNEIGLLGQSFKENSDAKKAAKDNENKKRYEQQINMVYEKLSNIDKDFANKSDNSKLILEKAKSMLIQAATSERIKMILNDNMNLLDDRAQYFTLKTFLEGLIGANVTDEALMYGVEKLIQEKKLVQNSAFSAPDSAINSLYQKVSGLLNSKTLTQEENNLKQIIIKDANNPAAMMKDCEQFANTSSTFDKNGAKLYQACMKAAIANVMSGQYNKNTAAKDRAEKFESKRAKQKTTFPDVPKEVVNNVNKNAVANANGDNAAGKDAAGSQEKSANASVETSAAADPLPQRLYTKVMRRKIFGK